MAEVDEQTGISLEGFETEVKPKVDIETGISLEGFETEPVTVPVVQGIEEQKINNSLQFSRELNIPPSQAFDMHEEIVNQKKQKQKEESLKHEKTKIALQGDFSILNPETKSILDGSAAVDPFGLRGLFETSVSLGTGIASWLASFPVGMGEIITQVSTEGRFDILGPYKNRNIDFGRVFDAMTEFQQKSVEGFFEEFESLKPKTLSGQQWTEIFAFPFQKYEEWGEGAAEWQADKICGIDDEGCKEQVIGVNGILRNVALLIVPGKTKEVWQRNKSKVFKSDFYKELNAKEKSLVIDEYQRLKKDSGFTEKELARIEPEIFEQKLKTTKEGLPPEKLAKVEKRPAKEIIEERKATEEIKKLQDERAELEVIKTEEARARIKEIDKGIAEITEAEIIIEKRIRELKKKPVKPAKEPLPETDIESIIDAEGLIERTKEQQITENRKVEAESKRFAELEIKTKQEESAKFTEEISKEKSEHGKLRKSIGFERHTKELPNSVSSRLNKVLGIKAIRDIKKTSIEQLQAKLTELKKLKKDDSFLTDKQIVGLDFYLNEGFKGRDFRLVTKREMSELFGDFTPLLEGAITKRISNNLFPTVDIKEGHPVITRIINKSDIEIRKGLKQTETTFKIANDLVIKAEKESTLKNKEVNQRIFRKMSGEIVENFTQSEKAVTDFLQGFFEQAKKDLALQKYRENYITHVRQTWLESIAEDGIFKTVEKFTNKKEPEISTDLLLALDDIIGSEKFFRFALERKGGLKPSQNIRKIIGEYSSILETKKALDKILPEAQASQQLLLKGKSALWMKSYLQNLKGRGLDFKFRQGKFGWVARIGDSVIDINYAFGLGLNWRSAVKNIVGGEVNSIVFQPFDKYISGKARFFANPRKGYKIASELGVLDGTYVDLATKGFLSKGKKFSDRTLFGLMKVAEIEMRTSFLLGEMTKAEWITGKVSSERYRQIQDGIAITQGIYTKIDSPLVTQTAMGRMALQYGRWKLTNSLLVRRIAKGMNAEIKAGNFKGKNTRRMLKMLATNSMFLYMSWQLGLAGYETAQKLAKAGSELMGTIFSIVTGESIYQAIAENPSFQDLDSLVYSAQELASYISGGLIEEPRKIKFRKGVTEKFSGTEQLFEDLGIFEEQKRKKITRPKIQRR